MQALVAVAMLIFVAAITPGPNNLMVLRAAANGGVRAAAPAIVSVMLGGVVMIELVEWGLVAVPNRLSSLRTGTVILGSIYLAWLGIEMGWRDQAHDLSTPNVSAPFGRALGLFAFQFANPKAWTLVLTAASAFHPDGGSAHAQIMLTTIFCLISSLCLTLWALLGSVAVRWLSRDSARRCFDRVMGIVLVASSVTLALHYWDDDTAS